MATRTEQNRRYYEKHKEKIKLRRLCFYYANRQKILERLKQKRKSKILKKKLCTEKKNVNLLPKKERERNMKGNIRLFGKFEYIISKLDEMKVRELINKIIDDGPRRPHESMFKSLREEERDMALRYIKKDLNSMENDLSSKKIDLNNIKSSIKTLQDLFSNLSKIKRVLESWNMELTMENTENKNERI